MIDEHTLKSMLQDNCPGVLCVPGSTAEALFNTIAVTLAQTLNSEVWLLQDTIQQLRQETAQLVAEKVMADMDFLKLKHEKKEIEAQVQQIAAEAVDRLLVERKVETRGV